MFLRYGFSCRIRKNALSGRLRSGTAGQQDQTTRGSYPGKPFGRFPFGFRFASKACLRPAYKFPPLSAGVVLQPARQVATGGQGARPAPHGAVLRERRRPWRRPWRPRDRRQPRSAAGRGGGPGNPGRGLRLRGQPGGGGGPADARHRDARGKRVAAQDADERRRQRPLQLLLQHHQHGRLVQVRPARPFRSFYAPIPDGRSRQSCRC